MEQFPEPWKPKDSKFYYFAYTRKDGKRINKSTREVTKKEAKKFIRVFIDKQRYTEKTLGEYCRPFYIWGICPLIRHRQDENKSIGIEHVRSQRNRLEKHILKDPIADKEIIDLIRGDLLDWRSRIRANHTPGTANNAMGVMKAILKHAYFRNDIDRDPTAGIGNIKTEKKEVGIFSLDELRKMFYSDEKSWNSEKQRLAFLIAAEAGLRRGEVMALQWQDIDWQSRIIHVVRAWKSWRDRILGPPKWNQIRDVPIRPQLYEALKSYNQDVLTCMDEDFIICDEDGSPQSSQSWMRWFNSALKRLKIEKKARNLKPHSFRHTFITHLEQAGVPGRVIQAIAGHRNEKTTDGYIHLETEYLIGELQKKFWD